MDGWDWKWNAASIRREQILPLFDLSFVETKENVLLIGKQGVGKSRIALALAHAACTRGVRTLFTTTAEMVNRLLAASATHSLEKALQIYARPELLVLDEVGYLPFGKEAGDLFFQVVSRRYEQGTIVLTTNRAFKNWNEIFADPIVATAIIERLVHHAQIFTFNGKSYRLKGKAQLETEPADAE
jgi:DNA replication protein DnaC